MNRFHRAARRKVTLLAFLAVAFVLGTGVALAQPGPYFQVGQAQQNAEAQSIRVVARVIGRPITSSDLAMRSALVGLNNTVNPTNKITDAHAALNAAVRDVALYDTAARQGFEPSAAELDVYVASIRAAFDNDATAKAQLTSYLDGPGVTEDAFFAQATTRSRYAQALAIARLRQNVVTGQSPASQSSAWSAFSVSKVASASVEVLDPALR